MTGSPRTEFGILPAVAAERLDRWVGDIILGRLERPTYENPGELKADIRVLLSELGQLREAALHVVLECRHGELTDGSLALLAEMVGEG